MILHIFIGRKDTHSFGDNPFTSKPGLKLGITHAFFMLISRLVTHFEEEAGRMLAFAGFTDVDLHALSKSVSIENRRISDGDKNGDFYRKGKVGEYWEVVQDEKIRRHVEQTLQWGKIGNPILRRIYSSYLPWSVQRRAKLWS